MDKRAAAEIVPILAKASQEIADTIDIVQRYASESDTKAYSDAAGEAVKALYFLMRPIIKEHPDLDPGGFSET